MAKRHASEWTALSPSLCTHLAQDRFVAFAQALVRLKRKPDSDNAMQRARLDFVKSTAQAPRRDRQALVAAGLVLHDLAVQAWHLRVYRGVVELQPPAPLSQDQTAEKERVRGQELVKRDAQLREVSVKRFVTAMEHARLFEGRSTSIFSLMRDGRDLAEALRNARRNNASPNDLTKVLDPYIEFVSSADARCRFTGLRVMDIWRYFRHTWTNQYTSVPGRTMMFLVRDRAAPFHPVIGIGALSSPVMQIRQRDTWIGWHPETFLAHVRTNPTVKLARWLVTVVDTAISEVYIDDLVEEELLNRRQLSRPDAAVIERLLTVSIEQRRLHHRFVLAGDHKAPRPDTDDTQYWVARARTHLFRSKRALALASYLSARMVLSACFGKHATADKLAALAATVAGRDAIRKIVKKAKSDRVGIALADISVCGAIQPYNAILGGKLIAMLATSPEVVYEYRRKYSRAASEIASSVAGRAIVRKPELVLLGTTSLYGVGSSQYNRINIPCNRLGGDDGNAIRYVELGRSEAFGTSQYSEETVQALVHFVQQSTDGERVNSIFGEGGSPKLRKVRQALDLLGLPSGLLLQHHRRRIVYAVSLVRNLDRFMLGIERKPDYLVPITQGSRGSEQIASWWRERWLHTRIASDAVLDEVARHTLVRPVQHGARVKVFTPSDECRFDVRNVA